MVLSHTVPDASLEVITRPTSQRVLLHTIASHTDVTVVSNLLGILTDALRRAPTMVEATDVAAAFAALRHVFSTSSSSILLSQSFDFAGLLAANCRCGGERSLLAHFSTAKEWSSVVGLFRPVATLKDPTLLYRFCVFLKKVAHNGRKSTYVSEQTRCNASWF